MNAIEIVKEQVLAYNQGINHAVVTITHSDGSAPRSNGKMIVYANGATKGTVGGGAVERLATRDALQCIREGSTIHKSYDLTTPASETGMTCGGTLSVLIEAYVARPLLVMCGAGHVGGAVLSAAKFVGFETLLIDDREESQISDKIEKADRFVKVKNFEEDLKALEIPEGAHIVIATHGHAFDGSALAGALAKKAAYVGMIGSSKKIGALFKQLTDKGFSQEQLEQVFTPIGLDIGGETPEEIALAIMAEILMVKNGRSGSHWVGKEK